jgi:glycosyltransferase involved in cell wall biosynthesis
LSRILIWSPNYAPELIGIPPLVTSAAEWLAGRGHAVEVVTALPNYPERVIRPEFRGTLYRSGAEGGVGVHRSWLRVRPEESALDKALYEGSFALVSLPRVLTRAPRADVVVCVVPSLAAAALAATVVRPRRLVIWVQDLVALAAESLDSPHALSRRAARALERAAYVRADRIVVCSPGFERPVREAGAGSTPIDTVYNWVDTEEITAQPPPAGSPTRFLYAGNLGYTQGFETLIDGAKLAGDGVQVEIVGGGNAFSDLAGLSVPNVAVRPSVPRGEYPGLLARADVHVVVQRRVSAGANLPSKIASYLASGRPVLASIDGRTAAAELLRESGAAVFVEPEDAAALAGAMRRLRDDAGLRAELGAKARAFAERRLAKERSLEQLEEAILP